MHETLAAETCCELFTASPRQALVKPRVPSRVSVPRCEAEFVQGVVLAADETPIKQWVGQPTHGERDEKKKTRSKY